jgi:hypothetical protein
MVIGAVLSEVLAAMTSDGRGEVGRRVLDDVIAEQVLRAALLVPGSGAA